MIYLASPYTSELPEEREQRYHAVKAALADLILGGKVVFSPIVHGHHVAIDHKLPKDYDFWQKQCLGMLAKSRKLVVLTLPGWHKSRGVQDEIEFAKKISIPISYLSPTEG